MAKGVGEGPEWRWRRCPRSLLSAWSHRDDDVTRRKGPSGLGAWAVWVVGGPCKPASPQDFVFFFVKLSLNLNLRGFLNSKNFEIKFFAFSISNAQVHKLLFLKISNICAGVN